MAGEDVVGREPVQIVEIVQPFCTETYGVAPCTASLGADAKCYNTRSTCQDTANWDAGTLDLFFGKGLVGELSVIGSGTTYIIPSLVSVSTSPAKLNYAAAGPDSQGLGNRALCTITFQDHPHTDRLVDPYLSGRSWDPMDADRGSFWTRWITRNKYRKNIRINVYDGYAGQTLAAMSKRTYFLDKISNVDSSGRVRMTGKDVLARVEERKAQAPAASPGKLFAQINAGDLAIEVTNAVAGDYGATGKLRIGDELMDYNAIANTANGITFTITERGANGTIADEHDYDTAVQECLVYSDESVDTVLADLMTTYGSIDAAWLDTANWATEVSTYLSLYKLSAIISEPVSVYKLISEISEQTLCNIWWDERDALVKIRALRGYDTVPDTINDAANVISGTVSIDDMPRERASQIWTYYNLKSAVARTADADNYRNQYVVADLESETEDLYGSQSIRTIYSRWLASEPLIKYSANKILASYVDTPQEISFSMDAKDRTYWIADSFFLSHYLDVDEFGDRRERLWTITSAEETAPGDVVSYTAISTDTLGQLHYIMASSAADYTGYGAAPAKNCYIGDGNGVLLFDGEASGVIR